MAIDSYALYTNLPPAGALRGFGIPQLVWAYESHTDLIARELGIDPIEFRRRNLLREGRPQATGTRMKDAALEKVLERLESLMEWKKPVERGSGAMRRGRGIAIGFKACIANTTSLAAVNVNADGSCRSTRARGHGTGLGYRDGADCRRGPAHSTEAVTVVHSDTDVTPFDMATLGSRSLFHSGNAVKLAAEDALRKINELKAELGLAADTAIADVFRKKYGMRAGSITGAGNFIPPYTPPDENGQTENATPFWMVGASGVEVEVDTETGRVRVTRLQRGRRRHADQSAHRGDAALRRRDHAARLHLVRKDALRRRWAAAQRVARRVQDSGFSGPACGDRERSGDLGAVDRTVRRQGCGRNGDLLRVPAIANAIHDAIGVRLTELPMSPEAVWEKLR